MLRVNKINSGMSFHSERTTSKDNLSVNDSNPSNSSKIVLALSGLAAIGMAAVGIKKGKVVSLEKTLLSNGIELKEGIAFIKETGEKYTGTINRISKSFGREVETVQFENGMVTEKLYHNAFGKELRASFYKNGQEVCAISVTGSRFSFSIMRNGKLDVIGSGIVEKDTKLFPTISEDIKKGNISQMFMDRKGR